MQATHWFKGDCGLGYACEACMKAELEASMKRRPSDGRLPHGRLPPGAKLECDIHEVDE